MYAFSIKRRPTPLKINITTYLKKLFRIKNIDTDIPRKQQKRNIKLFSVTALALKAPRVTTLGVLSENKRALAQEQKRAIARNLIACAAHSNKRNIVTIVIYFHNEFSAITATISKILDSLILLGI